MAELDQLVMKEQEISSSMLMERVGQEIARRFTLHIRKDELPNGGRIENRRVLVLVGPGNNGGDGLVVARHLIQTRRYPVSVVLVGAKKLSDDCRLNLVRLLDLNQPVFGFGGNVEDPHIPLMKDEAFERLFFRSGIIIDALLGTGQSGPLRGPLFELVSTVQRLRTESPSQKKLFLSIDIPTGVSGDTGQVFSPSFDADLTFTVQHQKFGMTQGAARKRCGKVLPIEAGIRSPHWRPNFFATSRESLKDLPPRSATSHKGTYGHVLVLGGSKKMPGAASLSSIGASSTGAGKVTQVVFDSGIAIPPEIMRIPLTGNFLDPNNITDILSRVERGEFQALVVGPGLGTAEATLEAFEKLLSVLTRINCPTVIDADGLNLLSCLGLTKRLAKARNFIITPHPGEAARLLGLQTALVVEDSSSAVKQLHLQYGAVSLLKGAGTVIWDGKTGAVNTTGTGFLATGGTGDVLAGMIGGFMAQGLSPFKAGCLGAFLHGKAAEELGNHPFPASVLGDVARNLIAVSDL
ncbi:MAG: NAD(P)H-hydrate dehydratase [Bdellovibrionales bacterium]|nr:NAD(P)H-hydrate dehydratase [Bdellovibrionales bacterium]